MNALMKPANQSYRKRTRLRVRLLLISLSLVLMFPVTVGQAKLLFQINPSRDRAQALLDTLTAEERVGQLFLVTFTGTDIGQDSQIFDLIVNHHIGGVILQKENDNFTASPQTLTQAFQLVRELQTAEWSASQAAQIDPATNQEFTPAFIPLFVGLSQEGNGSPYDQIFNGNTALPSQMALGATWQPDLAQQVGTVLGAELSALGMNILLGPSLDVLESPREKGTDDLGVRSFSGDPFWVGEMGSAYVSGIHEGSSGRIAVIAKHFPGHGSSDRLPEEEVATVRKSLEQLKQIELPPFYAVTGNAQSPAATVDGLLASHIRYQGFQGNIRETTRPVSLDRQAFDQLMSLPPLAIWRENGGMMVSENLGSHAFRRFVDPTGSDFQARFIARDSFLTGNDLLFLGSEFVATNDPDYYTTILHTITFFAQKYREDPAFQQQVDASALRILTLKYRLYKDIFTLSQVLPDQDGLANLGKSSQTTFQVAQEAATLISPSLADLAETLPESPNLNDQIVFISQVRTAQQCSECPVQQVFAQDALEQAVIRLYGPSAGGQVLQRNLESYSFEDLVALLDQNDQVDLTVLETDLQQANWIVFSMLNVSTNSPQSQALSRFLAERPDLFRQKNLVVFAFDAPYYLDATEISKLNAYYGLYSKTPQFVEVAARLLFGELLAPPGDLPVSVPGVDYDLISATAPDPAQTIQLFLDLPEPGPSTGTETPEPIPPPLFEVSDLIPVRTGIILDHNGHPVPDDTPVDFVLVLGGTETSIQTEITQAGIARTSFLVEASGALEIHANSDPAMESTVIQFDISSGEVSTSVSPATILPTESPTSEPLPTSSPTPEPTLAPPARNSPDFIDWLLALVVATMSGSGAYWIAKMLAGFRWGVRSSLLALSGGLLGYTYLALGLPGSLQFLHSSGAWGVVIVTLLGSGLGWGAAWGWQRINENKG